MKNITVRWDEEFWATVAKLCVDRRTSLQALITDAVCEKLGIAAPGSATDTEEV